MLGGDELFTFLTIVLLYAFMPGPAMLYSVSQTLANGRQGGIMAVLGLHVGGYVHVALAVIGVSVLFLTYPLLKELVQTLGACYLIYLGVQKIGLQNQPLTVEQTLDYYPSKTFWDSVIVDVLNPKAALFYLSFLPQFVNTDNITPVAIQLLLLGVATNIIFSSADLLSVLGASYLRTVIEGESGWLYYGIRWAGSVLVVLGVTTLFSVLWADY
ncbi:LysE family translocator [Vibrio fortis]|uniref:LysE family translocator n=1 Tax=Vibrio fortis TaxID=212667 RepID=UPI00406968BA